MLSNISQFLCPSFLQFSFVRRNPRNQDPSGRRTPISFCSLYSLLRVPVLPGLVLFLVWGLSTHGPNEKSLFIEAQSCWPSIRISSCYSVSLFLSHQIILWLPQSKGTLTSSEVELSFPRPSTAGPFSESYALGDLVLLSFLQSQEFCLNPNG